MTCGYCGINTDAQLHMVGMEAVWLCPACLEKDLRKYEVTASWQEIGTYKFLAESEDGAIDQANQAPLPEDGSYADNSFEIDSVREIGVPVPRKAFASPLTTVKEENIVDLREPLEIPASEELEIKWEPESHWSEHPNWSVEDWKHEIVDDSTRQGYHEWVRSKITEALEKDQTFNIAGTRTGRWSGTEPNKANVPKSVKIKHYGEVTETIIVKKEVEVLMDPDAENDAVHTAVREKAYEIGISNFFIQHGWECVETLEVDVNCHTTGEEVSV